MAVTQRDRAVAPNTMRACANSLSLLLRLCVKKSAGGGALTSAAVAGSATPGPGASGSAPARARSAGGIRDEDESLEHCRVALTADIIPLLINIMTLAKDDEVLVVRHVPTWQA